MKTLSPQLIVSTVSLLFVAAGIVPLAQAVAPASPQQQPDLQIPAGLFCEIDAFQLLPTLGPDGFPDIQKVQLSDEDQVIAGPIYINLSVANVGSLGADGLSTFFGVWGNRTKLLDLTDTTDLGVGAPYYESLVLSEDDYASYERIAIIVDTDLDDRFSMQYPTQEHCSMQLNID